MTLSVPELLCLNKAFTELCLHAKGGCQLAAVVALTMDNGGVHGGQGTFDAIQQLRRGIFLLPSQGSNFVLAELYAKLLQCGLQSQETFAVHKSSASRCNKGLSVVASEYLQAPVIVEYCCW